MGKTKHPDDVEEKDFSDSLELFDALFQEELEDRTDTKELSKGPAAARTVTPKALPDHQLKKPLKTDQKRQPPGPADRLAAKRKKTPAKAPDVKENIDLGKNSESGQPGKGRKPIQDKKATSTENQDTLEMARKGGLPKLELDDVEENQEIEREFLPQGIILKGVNRLSTPISTIGATPAEPDKVGKLYTPKVSKGLISGISIKESNLYKVVLAGFAFAIVVMVLINFFGIMGTDDSKKDSKPPKKEVAEATSLKKPPHNVVKAPKASQTAKAENRVKKKKSLKSVSPSKGNRTVTTSNAKRPPAAPSPAPSPVSKPQPRTLPPPRVKEQPSTRPATRPVTRQATRQATQPQTMTQKSTPEANTTVRTPVSQNSSSQDIPGRPFSSPEASTTVVETASVESAEKEKPPEPAIVAQPETRLPQASVPPSAEISKPVEAVRATPEVVTHAYPYSVYLGAYKTLGRAKVAVSLYQEQGLSSYWVKVDLGSKGTWFRVFTGHFKNEDEAQKFIDAGDFEEASVKKTSYATLIGVYSSSDAIEKKSQALLQLGYSAYVVKGADGTSQLYSGAFYTRSGAEQLYKELAAKGIQNQVVER